MNCVPKIYKDEDASNNFVPRYCVEEVNVPNLGDFTTYLDCVRNTQMLLNWSTASLLVLRFCYCLCSGTKSQWVVM